MDQNSLGQQTKAAIPAKDGAQGRGTIILVSIFALVIVVAIGWIVTGLPGLHRANSVSVALLLIALISGSLTLIFVVDTVRKARKRQVVGARDMVVVLVCSLITATVAMIQLVQTLQQLPH